MGKKFARAMRCEYKQTEVNVAEGEEHGGKSFLVTELQCNTLRKERMKLGNMT